jgi:hypothetical protein
MIRGGLGRGRGRRCTSARAAKGRAARSASSAATRTVAWPVPLRLAPTDEAAAVSDRGEACVSTAGVTASVPAAPDRDEVRLANAWSGLAAGSAGFGRPSPTGPIRVGRAARVLGAGGRAGSTGACEVEASGWADGRDSLDAGARAGARYTAASGVWPWTSRVDPARCAGSGESRCPDRDEGEAAGADAGVTAAAGSGSRLPDGSEANAEPEVEAVAGSTDDAGSTVPAGAGGAGAAGALEGPSEAGPEGGAAPPEPPAGDTSTNPVAVGAG